MTHGTRYGYKTGCRCPDCRLANRDYNRGFQNRRRGRMATGLIDAASELPVLDGLPAGEWVTKAVCRGRDEWEMTENAMRSRNTRKFANTGIAVDGCLRCPSLTECRTWVMSHTIDPCGYHVVAAMTPKQRNEERVRLGMPTPARRYGGTAA